MALDGEQLLKELLEPASRLNYGDGNTGALKERIIMITKKIFGDSSSYISSIRGIHFSPQITRSNMDKSYYISSFESGKRRLINTINLMIEDLQLSAKLDTPKLENIEIREAAILKKIFIVHGHNEEMKQSVARFVEKIDLEPIILHEQASQGRTIIEKFTIHSDVPFAIVLLSADDLGVTKDADLSNGRFRARQNVIFELGFFLGKLGRENVVVLHEIVEDFEFPSDYQGVAYIPYDANGNWKFSTMKELKAAGFRVDANLVL